MLFFILYSTYLFHWQDTSDSMKIACVLIRTILLIINFFQMYKLTTFLYKFGFMGYFWFEKWNIFEFIMVLLILSALVADTSGGNRIYISKILSIASLMLWFKSFYYMRIFR
jgi:hypothetical protein